MSVMSAENQSAFEIVVVGPREARNPNLDNLVYNRDAETGN